MDTLFGSKKKTVSHQVQSNKVDPGQMGLLTDEYTHAKDLEAAGMPQFGQERVAPRSSAGLLADDMILSGVGGAGSDAMTGAVGAAQRASTFKPRMITDMIQDAQGVYRPAAARMGTPTAVKTATANAPGLPGTALANTTKMNAANAGPAATALGSLVKRGDVRDLSTESGLGGLDAYLNPYLDEVVNKSLGDIDYTKRLALKENDMAAQAHGGWNGSRHGVVDVGTNAEALKAAGTTGANLRYTGFNDAATRLMSDRDRKLAADQSNQGVDYNVATGNADRSQQNTQFNAGADNAMRSFNAGLLQDAEGRNAGMETDTSRFNAGNTNDIGKFGAGLLADLEQFNAGSENSMGQFNAGMAADADRFNATADNERDTFNAQTGTNVNLANTGARNAGLLADQGAGLAGADLNLRGGSMLGDLSKTQLNELLTKGGAVRQVGQDQQGQQQAQDDANFSDYTRSLDWLLQMLNGRRAALGMQPIQQTQTSDGKTTEQTSMGLGSALLGSLGSLASAGSMGLFGSGMSNWMNGTGGGAVPLNPTTFSVPMQMGGGSAYGRV